MCMLLVMPHAAPAADCAVQDPIQQQVLGLMGGAQLALAGSLSSHPQGGMLPMSEQLQVRAPMLLLLVKLCSIFVLFLFYFCSVFVCFCLFLFYSCFVFVLFSFDLLLLLLL